MAGAGWYADPSGRHEQRYFDGGQWTATVMSRGVVAVDTPIAPIAPWPVQTQVVVKQNHGCLWAFGIAGALVVAALAAIWIAAAIAVSNVDVDPVVNDDGVSRGFGSQDAAADVTSARVLPPPERGLRQVEVTVTNHSSKRSNYSITLSIESPDGTMIYTTTSARFSNIGPGQSATVTAQIYVSASAVPVPADAVAKPITVARTAAT